MLNDQLLEDFILLSGPLCFVAAQFLDEKPSFVTLFGVLGWYNFGDLLPIVVVEVFHEFGVLDHERKEAILKQMCLIILPLGQCP